MRITRKFPMVLLLLCAALTQMGCRSSENEYIAPPPPQVTVAQPVAQAITPYMEKNGETEAVAEAEVRARVTGFIQEINFLPGERVDAEAVLYTIEPDQYQAAVNSAQAAVAAAKAAVAVAEANIKTAEAEVTNAELTLKRERELLARDAGSQADVDNAVAANDSAIASLESARANARAAEAQVGRAQADLDQAQLDLGYTTVRAPISGRITKTEIKLGNLVQDGSMLAEIIDDQSIFANFSISDRELLRFLEDNRPAGAKPTDDQADQPTWRNTPVYLSREIDSGFPFMGRLEYVDSEGIDPDTGTLGLRAEFDNADGRLLPGMFVSVRVPTGDPYDAMLIPEYAISRDQRGSYVLTINEQAEAERTSIEVARTSGGWAIVQSGLTPDSQVVIDGIQRARPGLQVEAVETTLQVDDQTLLRGLPDPNSDTPAGSNPAGTIPASPADTAGEEGSE